VRDQDDDKTQTHVVLSKGTIVSHYRIAEKIGAGGMGEVYLAEDTELDRKVALKFLPPHLCQDEDCRKRFKREAQAAAKLSHPNIVTIHEVGEHQTRPYFVMEHIEGRSLRDVKTEELDIDRIIGIAVQLCDGLHSAHAAGVIHRDIKPSNIIIDSSGRPRLLDFGLATVKGSEHLTKTGSTLGTVGYMSPEQIEGEPTDARSDLFSLGVVLYELITNKSPFRRDDEAATLKAILQDAPEPLARYKSGVLDDLQRIVSKLLEKDPTLRYQSAAGVIPDLKKLSAASTSSAAIERKRDRWNRYVVSSAVVFLLAVLAVWYFGYREQAPSTSSDDDRVMLAVLPFENLGDPEDEYFADGLTDEIISRLAGIKRIGVISRTSIMRYKNSEMDLPDIADQLGVDYIVEGTIRWDKRGDPERIRITPQLIEASSNTHLWANPIEEEITRIFEVQANMAEEIARALDISLPDSGHDRLGVGFTGNIEAYNYYLRGLEYHRVSSSPFSTNHQLAIEMFEKAVTLDSTFASASAWLARLYAFDHFNAVDRSGMRLSQAELAARRASRYSSGGADGHLAMGYYYYYGSRDYEAALHEFEAALVVQPNNSELLHAIGAVQRRQGKWDKARESFKASLSLDPLNPTKHVQLLFVLDPTRRFEECLEVIDHGLAIAPDFASFYVSKFFVIYNLYENLEMAREILEQASQVVSECELEDTWEHFHFWARDYASAAAQKCPLEGVRDTASYYLAKADTYRAMNDSVTSFAFADSARRTIERQLETQPDYHEHHSNLGLALALLQRKNEAVESGLRATRLLPVSKDAYRGFQRLQDLAKIYALVGEKDLAIETLDSLLSIPSHITVARLRIDPMWDPLRDHPRFQALIENYDKEHGK
jgi:serine/threonine protein kinase